MKEYTKPEVEYVDFVAENITDNEGEGNTGVISGETDNPWG